VGQGPNSRRTISPPPRELIVRALLRGPGPEQPPHDQPASPRADRAGTNGRRARPIPPGRSTRL